MRARSRPRPPTCVPRAPMPTEIVGGAQLARGARDHLGPRARLGILGRLAQRLRFGGQLHEQLDGREDVLDRGRVREHRFPQHDLECLDLARGGEFLLGTEHVERGHVAEVHRQIRAAVGALLLGRLRNFRGFRGLAFGVGLGERLGIDLIALGLALGRLLRTLGSLRSRASYTAGATIIFA